jgi:hypothetical protein
MQDIRQQLFRRRQIVARLPPLEAIVRGSVFTRQLRCGKPTCHCARPRGARHRAVYLSVSFGRGRTVQITLAPAVVATARGWVANYQAWWRAIEAVSAINRDLLRRRAVAPPAGAPAPRPPRRRSAGSGRPPRRAPRRR